MTKDHFEENLALMKEFNEVLAPGGVGQVKYNSVTITVKLFR